MVAALTLSGCSSPTEASPVATLPTETGPAVATVLVTSPPVGNRTAAPTSSPARGSQAPSVSVDTAPPSAAPTTTPATTESATTEPAWPRRLTLAFSGDTLPHSPLWRQAAENAAEEGRQGFDFGPMLAGIAPLVEPADLAICHLETPIAPVGEELSTVPFYGVPAEIAVAIAGAGYDRCSTASNHAWDRGTAGIDRTVDVLGAAGLGQSGMARTPDEIEPHLFEVGGVTVSHLSYTFSYNGLSLPADQQWRSALIEVDRIVADATWARAIGAQVVIVSMHWGTEGSSVPNTFQRLVAEAVTASGQVDVIAGHHAHVVQPIEQINGVWVLFGLGNILSNLPTSDRWPAASQDAMVVTLTMTVGADGSVVVERPVAHPTWVDKHAGWIVRDVDAELARPDLAAAQRALLDESRRRTVAVVGDFTASG
jgi:poly-gamma-glutamate synthesis protein (capsule biosynthesis protein)